MATKLAFTYENLRQIQIKEKNSSGLTRLEPEFYEDFFTHLGKLESEYLNLTSTGEKQTETVLLSEEIRKLKSLMASLYERRERKLIFLAQVEARGGKPDTKNLTNLERHLYDGLVSLLKRTRAQLITKNHAEPARASGIEDDGQTETTVIQKDRDVEVQSVKSKNSKTADGPEKASGKRLILVEILKDVDPFQDADLRKYYPKKEDVIHLPVQYAEILVKRGAARIIENTY